MMSDFNFFPAFSRFPTVSIYTFNQRGKHYLKIDLVYSSLNGIVLMLIS